MVSLLDEIEEHPRPHRLNALNLGTRVDTRGDCARLRRQLSQSSCEGSGCVGRVHAHGGETAGFDVHRLFVLLAEHAHERCARRA